MRFSARERYGLRAMAELARLWGQGPIPLRHIASAQDLSLDYLEHIVAPLRRAGLLVSTRGAQGGYTLARPPEEISVGDVIRALEGAIVTLPCLDEQQTPNCERERSCVTLSVWEQVHQHLEQTLDQITLAHLLQCCPDTYSPQKGATEE